MDSSTTGRPSGSGAGSTFMERATSFTEVDRVMLINVLQYVMMVALPIAALDMGLSYMFHEGDTKEATSPELLGGIIAELVLAALGLYVIHKLAMAAPTWTGSPIGPLNLFNMVTGILLAKFSYSYDMLTKASLLMGRVAQALGLADGGGHDPKEKKKQASPMHHTPPPARHQASRADQFYDQGGVQAPSYQEMVQTASMPPPRSPAPGVGRGPPPGVGRGPPPSIGTAPQEPPPATSSALYGGPETPLQHAQTPGVQEPMAANEALGGAFASW